MGGDEEGEEEVVVLVDVPAEQAGRDHAVAEAGDREGLGDALQQPEDDGLEVGDRVHQRPAGAGGIGFGRMLKGAILCQFLKRT